MSETAIKHRKPAGKPLIALTGATGFIGQYLLDQLPKRGYRLRVLLRRPTTLPKGCASAVIGDLARPYNMAEALAEVDAVIHTAGLASTMSGVPEDDYRLFNTEATVGFAKAAQRARVKRFVFLSSIRAQSGPTADGTLTEDSEPRPTDAYGRSKLAAEQGLAETELDWVALRLALVYGPGVEGNMAQAGEACPLPLPAAAGRTHIGTFLAWSRQSGRGRRQGAGGGSAAEAPAHRRRPQAPHHRRDDRGHAPRPRPASRVVLRAEAAAQGRAACRGTGRQLRAAVRLSRR